MKIQRAAFVIIVILAIVFSSACNRSLATNNSAKPTSNKSTSQPSVTQTSDVAGQLYFFSTQTAMAAMGGAAVTTPGLETPIAPPPATQMAVISPEVVNTPIAQIPTQAAPVVPTQPKILATAPPLVVPATYTLQTGEFPFCIARRFNVDPGALMRMNGLNSYSVYYAGMALRIPQGAPTFPGNRALLDHPTSYTVRGGDSIYTIACAFGDVDPGGIAVVNGLNPPYKVSAGTVLQIP